MTRLRRSPLFASLKWFGLALVLFLGSSYRLYLARFNTEVGIPDLANWYSYIPITALSMLEGDPISETLYAPGQVIASFVIFNFFPTSAAALRVAFGLLDGVAIVFLFLLIREMAGWGPGLVGALAYALWPEGASASVNILYDHSPQPLFLFAGLWLLLVWLRRHRWPLLVAAGALLGMPAMFRTDGMTVAIVEPVLIVAVVGLSRARRRTAVAAGLVLFASTLIPSVPWDVAHYRSNGFFVHIASGDLGSAIFYRYGRVGGLGGMRENDSEVSQVNGAEEPFGFAWSDARRFRMLSAQGRDALFADPLRYASIVLHTSAHQLLGMPGQLDWLAPGVGHWSDLRLAGALRNPEWPLAVFTSISRVQAPLSHRGTLLAVAAVGLLLLAGRNWRTAVLVAGPMVLWAAALVVALPESRYFTMPFCLLFPFIGIAVWFPVRVARALLASGRASGSAAPTSG